MLKILHRLKLSTRITIITLFLLLMLIVQGAYSLLKIHHLELEVVEIAEQEIPLSRVVARLTEYMLDQATRFGETLQYANLGNREKFDQNMAIFIEAGHRIVDIIRQGKEIAETAIKKADSEEKKKEFKHIKHSLINIEKEHAEYEHHSEELFLIVMSHAVQEEPFVELSNSDEVGSLHGKANVEDSSESEKNNLASDYKVKIEHALEVMEREEDNLKEELEAILEVIDTLTSSLTEEAEAEQKEAFLSLSLLFIFAFGSGITLSILISGITVQQMKNSISSLILGSEEFLAASKLVASSSTSLATESEKQSLALNETTIIVESMSELSNDNVSLANKEEELIIRVESIVNNIHKAINEIMISNSIVMKFGDEIGPLIRLLNDDVIQLNLLATSATAEVVEKNSPRRLIVFTKKIAGLAAQAAKTTRRCDELAMSSITSIRRSFELSENSTKDFNEIVSVVERLKEILLKDVGASKIWDKKIKESNRMLGEINSGILANAATSEQNASASEELSAQAVGLLEVVDNLSIMTGDHTSESKSNKMNEV